MSRISFGIVSLALALLVAVAFYAGRIADRHEAAVKLAEGSLTRLGSQAHAIEQRLATAAAGTVDPESPASELPAPSAATRRRAFAGGRLAAHYTENPGLTKSVYVPLVRKYFDRFYAAAPFVAINCVDVPCRP
jgi:hypothetical protein